MNLITDLITFSNIVIISYLLYKNSKNKETKIDKKHKTIIILSCLLGIASTYIIKNIAFYYMIIINIAAIGYYIYFFVNKKKQDVRTNK